MINHHLHFYHTAKGFFDTPRENNKMQLIHVHLPTMNQKILQDSNPNKNAF